MCASTTPIRGKLVRFVLVCEARRAAVSGWAVKERGREGSERLITLEGSFSSNPRMQTLYWKVAEAERQCLQHGQLL